MANGSVVVVGGTRGLGRELAQFYADQGRDVVITGRDAAGAKACAAEIGGSTRGIGLDLAEPNTIAGSSRRSARSSSSSLRRSSGTRIR